MTELNKHKLTAFIITDLEFNKHLRLPTDSYIQSKVLLYDKDILLGHVSYMFLCALHWEPSTTHIVFNPDSFIYIYNYEMDRYV